MAYTYFVNQIINAVKALQSAMVSNLATADRQDTQQDRLDLLATEATTDAINTAIGAQADVAKTDATQDGSAVSFIKGQVKILEDVWDQDLKALRASVQAIRASVSTKNSSITPLGANEEFVGDWEYVADHSIISMLIRADVASDTLGFKVEFSPDGITVVNGTGIADDAFTIDANTGKIFTFGSYAAYMRVRYKNGPAPQNQFILHTILHPAYCKPSSHKIAEPITDETDAEMVLAAVTARQDNGEYTVISATDLGSFKVAQTDRPSELRGRIKVEAQLEFKTSADGTLTLVPGMVGYKFVMTTIGMSLLNDSTSAFGRLVIRDGVGGPVKLPYLAGVRSGGSGATATVTTNPTDFSDGPEFLNAVVVQPLAGTLTYSIFVLGYREPL